MKGDQKAVVDCGMTRATPRRLGNLSSNRENSVLVADEPPDGVTSLKTEIDGKL